MTNVWLIRVHDSTPQRGSAALHRVPDQPCDVPSRHALRDAFGVRRGTDGKIDLNGKDMLVSEMLAWIGRSAPCDTGMIDYYAAQVAALKAKREQEN